MKNDVVGKFNGDGSEVVDIRIHVSWFGSEVKHVKTYIYISPLSNAP
jgi:hypothetical protein